MNPNRIKLLSGLAAACLAWSLLADTNNLPQDFPHQVQYELGDSEFAPGDLITIQELRGTAENIRPGETYCVTGTYTLASAASADLAFYATTTNRTPTPVDPRQTMHIVKGSGTFCLIKPMTCDGYLHLSFYPRPAGQGFGGVYFGQNPWVLRHKQWSYRDSAAAPGKPDEPVATGPNQALYAYLGNPVPPPANLDPAYTKDGLTRAMQTAAQNAGVTLVKLEIDDSEFPCLVGMICAKRGDWSKMKEQFRALPAYEFKGGIGGDDRQAMNLVPYNAYPPGASQRIYHRQMLREAVLYDRLNQER